MNPKYFKPTPSQQLSTLVEMLDSNKPVPTDLASDCASLIREALKNAGKLRLNKGPGAPRSEHKQFDRAFAVALMVVNGFKRKAAIEQVAADSELKFATIEKDYKKWRKYARPQALHKKWIQDELLPRIDDLKELLATFEHDDRSRLSEADIDALFEILPADEVHNVAQKIEGASFRRDMKLLNEILS